MSLLAPSASRTSWSARSAQTSRTAAARTPGPGVTPEAPDASRSTVSLVDMQPSESTRSKVTRVAARRASSSSSAVATASVVRTTSMVARPGASMPAPLAIPPTVKPFPVATACLETESVVMMAVAAAVPPSAASDACASSTPGSSRSIGSRTPMSPVEQTATSPAPQPSRSATCSAVAWVSWKPSGPVHALAPPELRTTARNAPPTSTCWDQSTGAALNRLVVKTPAADWSGPSFTTSATSGAPLLLSPAATPAARNPCGAVTPVLTARPPARSGQPTPASRASGWRSGPPGRPPPCPGCRGRR